MSRPPQRRDKACYLEHKTEFEVSYHQPDISFYYYNGIFIQHTDPELVMCTNGWEYNTAGLFHSAVEDVTMPKNSNIAYKL